MLKSIPSALNFKTAIKIILNKTIVIPETQQEIE